MCRSSSGFSAVEMVVTMAVLAVLVGIAVPSFQDTLNKRRLIGAVEQLYGDLQFARNEVFGRNRSIHVTSNIQADGAWCHGIDDTAACNCTVANDCQVGGMPKVTQGSDFKGVTLGSADTITFDPPQAYANNTTVIYTLNGKQMKVIVSVLGRIRICSPSGSANITGYPEC